MGILDIFMGGVESDDVNVLPGSLVAIYLNPHRALGLDESSTNVSTLRETFRKLILGFIPYFTGLGVPKMTLRQVLLAYHLVRGTLKGPATKLKEILDNPDSPYFDFRPDDILPLLRPVRTSNFPIQQEYRGCRMLSLCCIDYKTTFSYTALPRTVFVFDVHYCMRRHTTEHDWEAFREIFAELSDEMISMPSFPHGSLLQTAGVSTITREIIGNLLADFVIRVHQMFASKGTFSPRLFRFLGIDFEKVQSEEEGAILAILDTVQKPYQTVWHLIDEMWLIRWRRFVMGRGARRYIPPGKMTNRGLLEESKKGGKRELKIGKHYRAVNYNVWRFYELVHGGGPVISRIDQDIYSKLGCSLLQAAIKIQTLIRMFLAMAHKEQLFIRYLSMRRAGKGVILQLATENLNIKIEEIMNKDHKERTEVKLKESVLFTQSNWRRKKTYVAATNLERLKEDQEIFTRSKGPAVADVAIGTEGLVVQEVLPIVHIGTTQIYERTLLEEENKGKLPFQVRKLPATEIAVITKSTDGINFVDGSKILSINENPTISMDYETVKKKLASSDWPLVISLEMPLRAEQKPTIHSLLSLNDEDIKYNILKMLLTSGINLIKHNSGSVMSSKHLSFVRISDKEFFYSSKINPSKPEGEAYNKFSLYTIKHVTSGERSDPVLSLRKVVPAHCFELITDEKGMIFEIPTQEKLEKMEFKLNTKKANLNKRDRYKDDKDKDDKDKDDKDTASTRSVTQEINEKIVVENNRREKEAAVQCQCEKHKELKDGEKVNEELYHTLLCAAFVSMLKKLIEEIRGSQIYVDSEGIVTKRTTAKTALRKVDKTN